MICDYYFHFECFSYDPKLMAMGLTEYLGWATMSQNGLTSNKLGMDAVIEVQGELEHPVDLGGVTKEYSISHRDFT